MRGKAESGMLEPNADFASRVAFASPEWLANDKGRCNASSWPGRPSSMTGCIDQNLKTLNGATLRSGGSSVSNRLSWLHSRSPTRVMSSDSITGG